MTKRSTKQDLILLILTVLVEFCYLTASLTIPEHAPQRITLISDSSVYQQQYGDYSGLENGDWGDKGGQVVRDSDLNDDHNLIVNDEKSLSSDSGIIINSGGDHKVAVAVASNSVGGQDIQPATGDDKQIDQVDSSSATESTEVPPLSSSSKPIRWQWLTANRTTNSYKDSVDTEEVTSGTGRNANNPQTNSGSAEEGVNAEELATTEDVTVTDAPEPGDLEEEVSEELKEEEEDESRGWECILGSSDVYLAWWINNDGSLRKDPLPKNETGSDSTGASVSNFIDLSGIARSEGTVFYKLLQRLADKRAGQYIPIKFLSLAHNDLARAPYSSLNLISTTLEYLSLAGNNFAVLNGSIIKDDNDDWATFPELHRLKELDLRSCRIASIHEDAFVDMQSLQKMYLSDNNLMTLSGQIFTSVRNLVHLDLSYNTIKYGITNYYTNPFELFTRGLEIDEFAFSELSNLKFLDFSHTRLEPSSMKSFVYLPSNLEQLSLCYTGITVIGLGMFRRLPNLKVLDLSGNSPLTGNMNRNTFDGLQNSLEILAFQNASLKALDWLGNLNSLKMLKLNDNNINQLANETFQGLPSLDILDLSDNHIGNWFSRVFEGNKELRIVNLRANNINMITSEMMKDFAPLEYLGLANNSFICNCLLRDLLDQALINAMPIEGTGYVAPVPNIKDLLINQVLINYLANIGLETASSDGVYDSYTRVLKSYVRRAVESYQRIRTSSVRSVANADAINFKDSGWRPLLMTRTRNATKELTGPIKKRYILRSQAITRKQQHLTRNKRALEVAVTDHGGAAHFLDSQEMDFNFQLLDFDEQSYTCFNATTNNEYLFTELESCLLERVAVWQNLVQQLRPHQRRVSVVLTVVFVVMLIVCLAYYKWWYIRYFCILIKNATILSFLNKESEDNGSRKSFGEISRADLYLYDVFVSYCDENRDWVINELLPNLEQRQEISICLHERDFLVGLSILENIIACMDRSKCLLLVVSQSFLLSQWCQFEMHLAQHRLLETCRERLVLILLEDIPKRKRPKTLGYLMKTKTYIKWPLARQSEKSHSLSEERKIFWKRLRRALIDTDWESDGNA